MDYHQNARTMVRSREQMAKMVIEEGSTLRAAAMRFEVSSKTAAGRATRSQVSKPRSGPPNLVLD